LPYGYRVTVMDREWTDKRTDDLADRVGRFEADVDRRFDEVDKRFDRLDDATKERFDKADALEMERFAAVHAELAVASKKTDKMIWILMGGFLSVIAGIAGNGLLG